jgi:hypothetical protein
MPRLLASTAPSASTMSAVRCFYSWVLLYSLDSYMNARPFFCLVSCRVQHPHPLVPMMAPYRPTTGFNCNVCRIAYPPTAISYHCKACGWDECQRCREQSDPNLHLFLLQKANVPFHNASNRKAQFTDPLDVNDRIDLKAIEGIQYNADEKDPLKVTARDKAWSEEFRLEVQTQNGASGNITKGITTVRIHLESKVVDGWSSWSRAAPLRVRGKLMYKTLRWLDVSPPDAGRTCKNIWLALRRPMRSRLNA